MSELVQLPTPVLPLPRTGSSGTGISYYTQVIRCPRKARLDKEQKEAGVLDERTEGAAATGIMVHQMDELYYGGIVNGTPAAIPVGDVNWGDAISEARRVWEAYIKRYPGPDFWGEVIATEQLIPGHFGQDAAVNAVIGASPFTVRIDRVIRVTVESAKRIAATTDLPPITPGVYLFDRKTKGKADGDAALTYFNSIQFAAYMMVYNAVYPNEPCLGMIVDEAITTKEIKFRHFLVTPPDAGQQQAVQALIANAKVLEETDACLGVAYGCKEYNRVCPHLTSGACRRY